MRLKTGSSMLPSSTIVLRNLHGKWPSWRKTPHRIARERGWMKVPSKIPLRYATRGRCTLFQSNLDIMWHMQSFVASKIDAQIKEQRPGL
jgi:hypothetical protein